MILDEKSVLREFVEEAIRLGADTLEVEHKSPHEEVYFMKKGLGSGITLDSSSDQAMSLRQELHALAKRKRRRFAFGGAQYELRARVYDSFGEDAFEVKLRRLQDRRLLCGLM
jgi:hypothetical protein